MNAPTASDTLDHPLEAVLEAAGQAARREGTPYAGGLSPVDAWRLVQAGQAVLVDVRSHEERKFVGQVPGSVHVAWATGTSLNRNPRFVRELESRAGHGDTLLLLCRSGKRSALAAEAAARAGFTRVFNVLEGFEGELDGHNRRGALGGWRFHGLPWSQD